MNIKYIKDALFDTMFSLAQDVYDNHDKIRDQAFEGLTGDMVDEYEDNVRDILREMVKEKLQ
jgi:hypothetical protein